MKRGWIWILCLGFFVSACRDEAPEGDLTEERAVKDEDMIGLSLGEAEKLATDRGLTYRVTLLEGELQPTTRDLRQDRVNFEVEAGKVVGVSRG